MTIHENWRLAPIHFHREDAAGPERLATYHGTVAGLGAWLRDLLAIQAVHNAERLQGLRGKAA